jgi:DegV family protein with EDD domain
MVDRGGGDPGPVHQFGDRIPLSPKPLNYVNHRNRLIEVVICYLDQSVTLVAQMKSVALLTDSSACLPLDSPVRRSTRILPIRIHLRSRDVLDATSGASDLVYEALAQREPVKSSAPTTVEYLTAIEEARSDAVVVITPATEFTGMYRNAAVAAEISERSAVVVDSRTAAAAQGLVVLAAWEAAEAGASVDDVVATAGDAASRADLVAALESVEFIERSGRVGPLALGLAKQLGVHPVFRLRDGAVERLGVPRSSEAVGNRIRKEAQASGLGTATHSMVFHAVRAERARRLQARLGVSGPVTEFSPAMGIHTGPGVIGVAWLRGS